MAKKSSKKTTSKKTAKKSSAKKKAAKKSAKKTTKKKPAKKTTKKSAKKTSKKAGKKSTKKTAKKSAAKKDSSQKSAKKSSAKKSAKKESKKAAKKTGKKGSKKSSKKNSKKLSKAVSGEKFAPGSKPKLSINLAPKGYKRNVAPGVAIDSEMIHPGLKNIKDNHKPEPPRKLSARDLRRIHDILIEKREQILSEIRHQVGDSLSRNSEVKTDTADRASDVLDGDVSYEMAVAGHHELEEIEAALEKIERKTYGKCEACDDEIGGSRLKVIPFATLCAKCRQMKEISGGENGSDSIWGFLDADAEDQPED